MEPRCGEDDGGVGGGAYCRRGRAPSRVAWYIALALTTDSDHISRLEGIIEQIAATLTALQQGQEALRTEMREGDPDLRAEMHNQMRMALLSNTGIWGTVTAGIIVAVVVPVLQA